jgi:hypothetical protein
VQSFNCIAVPLTKTRAFWMLAEKRRFVRRLEWLTLWPNVPYFPQISHLPGKAGPPLRDTLVSYNIAQAKILSHF